MRTVSPVGSRNRIGLSSEPAGVPSSETVSSIASRRPAALKRAASTAGLSGSGARTRSWPASAQARVVAVVRPRRTARCCAAPQPAGARRRRAPRRRCGVGGVAAFDADQQQARGDAALQLVEQHRLLGASAPTAGRPRGRRRSGRARRWPAPAASAAEPERQRQRGAPADREQCSAHRAQRRARARRRGSIVITERSPSASSTWTSRTVASRPRQPHRLRPGRAGAGRAAPARASSARRCPTTRRLEQALERGAVAGERAAHRLDDHRRLGRGVELHRAAALAEAHGQRVAVDRELLVARLERLADEGVGRRETTAGPTTSACGRASRRAASRRRSPRPTRTRAEQRRQRARSNAGAAAARAQASAERRRDQPGAARRAGEAAPVRRVRHRQATHRRRPRSRRS